MDLRKLLFILVFIFSASSIFADDLEIDKIRSLYIEAAEEEKACKQMLELLSAVDEKTPLLLGYKASATMMMANYIFSPFSKLSHFKKGRLMLEQALSADQSNVELRTLRYLTQVNAPSFLGYNSNIESDRVFILNHVSKIKDAKSKSFVIKILKQAKALTAEEERQLALLKVRWDTGFMSSETQF